MAENSEEVVDPHSVLPEQYKFVEDLGNALSRAADELARSVERGDYEPADLDAVYRAIDLWVERKRVFEGRTKWMILSIRSGRDEVLTVENECGDFTLPEVKDYHANHYLHDCRDGDIIVFIDLGRFQAYSHKVRTETSHRLESIDPV